MDYDPNLEPLNSFYQVEEKELTGEPGRLIRSEPLTGAVAPEAAGATYRVIYESTSGIGDQVGKKIAVSGIIAFPAEPPRSGAWPVVSWAHGTVGSADKCAPSMDQFLDVTAKPILGKLRMINSAPNKLLNAFLEADWAVAMTDYEGLGCYGNHPYLLGESEGRGIIDIVPVVRQLSTKENSHPIADEYAIVGHSQGGQAALWGAFLAATYARTGTLVGVAALAPASNLKGDERENGLWKAYQSPTADPRIVGDVGAFYPLFSNGVFGGAPDIDKNHIFQEQALIKYHEDYDDKARVELSEPDSFWMTTPPLGGIFRTQSLLPTNPDSEARKQAWRKYWDQVDGFNPAKEITVPIRISQAEGDKRVLQEKTRKLLDQLKDFGGRGPITEIFYTHLEEHDLGDLGDHFGLLVDNREIKRIIEWTRNPFDKDTVIDGDAEM